MLWRGVAGVLVGLLLLWVVLLVVLWRAKPDDGRVQEALRLLPDVLRLVTRLARDPSLPRGVRLRLWLLLGYLAMPIDVVPDVLPVIGYADDAVVVVWALRSVIRSSGLVALERHWPGTPEGLRTISALAGGAA